MKRTLTFGVAIVLALLLLPATVLAAGSTRHIHVAGSFTDSDFCGTGQTVEVKTMADLDLFGRRPHLVRGTGHSRTVFLNPENGKRLVLKSWGTLHLRRVDEEGGKIIVASLRGERSIIRIGKGPDNLFRSRDPGYVMYLSHFTDEGKYVSSEVLMRDLDASQNRAFHRLCRIAAHALDL
ncbi:MAG TPA: hypothetical protein VH741_11795 [Candidatus Limnocylindrales bacterium]|jgi:hypothetical protein